MKTGQVKPAEDAGDVWNGLVGKALADKKHPGAPGQRK
jgi:hypothetical protein